MTTSHVLQILADGPNGSSSVLDTFRTEWTNSGCIISTADSKFGGGSILFNTTTSNIYSAHVSYVPRLDIDDSTYTIQGWAKVASLTATQGLVGIWCNTTSNRVSVAITSGGAIRLSSTSTSSSLVTQSSSDGIISSNSWFHWVLQKKGLYWSVAINGVSVAEIGLVAQPIQTGCRVYFGWDGEANYISQNSRMDEIEIWSQDLYAGSVVQTGGSVVGGTASSLLHFDGSNGATVYTDEIGNVWDTGIIGPFPVLDTSVKKFGTASLRFPAQLNTFLRAPGTLNLLGFPDNGTMSDFCIDFWLYLHSTANGAIVSPGQGASTSADLVINLTSSRLEVKLSNNGTIICAAAGSNLTTGVWYHVAFTRSNGTCRLFVDGNLQSSGTYTNNNSDGGRIAIGCAPNLSAGANFNIDEFRVLVGAVGSGKAVYTANFTPPNSPHQPTDVDLQTVSLLHFEGPNAGTNFGDDTGKAWTGSGNAQLSTARSRFGGSSLLCDGTGDSISTADSTDFAISASGDFTVEFWVNFTNQANSDGNSIISVGNATGYWQVIVRNNTIWVNIRNATGGAFSDLIAPQTLNNNQWYHVAWTRSGTTHRLFCDGVLLTPTTNTLPSTFTTGNNIAYVGANYGGTTTSTEGYIDEVRIVKGRAEYTANFTPPTAPFAIPGSPLAQGVRDRLIHYYALDESAGTNVADAEPNSPMNLTTAIGTRATATIRTGGVRSTTFTGTSYASSSIKDAKIDAAGRVSLSCWIRLQAFSSSGNGIVLSGDSTENETGNIQFFVAVNPAGRLYYLHEYGAGTNETITASNMTPLALNTNYHIAVTRDSVAEGGTNTVRFYVNGALVDTQPYINARTGGTATSSRLQIGNGLFNGNEAWSLNGRMQDALFTTDLLTDAEVTWLYNGGFGRSSNEFFVSMNSRYVLDTFSTPTLATPTLQPTSFLAEALRPDTFFIDNNDKVAETIVAFSEELNVTPSTPETRAFGFAT